MWRAQPDTFPNALWEMSAGVSKYWLLVTDTTFSLGHDMINQFRPPGICSPPYATTTEGAAPCCPLVRISNRLD